MARATDPKSKSKSEPESEERRIYVSVTLSAEFKAALTKFGHAHGGRASAEIARRALAEYIDYDLSLEPATATRQRHVTVEDKADAAERARIRAKFGQVMMAWHKVMIAIPRNQSAMATLERLRDAWQLPTNTLADMQRLDAELAPFIRHRTRKDATPPPADS